MAEETDKQSGDAPESPSRKGAPALEPASDPALAGALDAFVRGDFRGAAEALPGEVADSGDDRAWRARLDRGLTWEPALWITAAICAGVWLWALVSAQPS